ncbi:hypothetical protein BU23DRAFT_469283 [Bimuria novae-zelandiae CBS 107.79]|uniref:F-box domain-containing protein n=1 Tax=Bimuria novae-zelandiae CBS 107.79 TaxID=1447943 RepID=A0A6A5V788_9PLEO|nr:hypothetical protein BU23DRAFT_469283 [Bimuria novae-zelandiae CBS 107.79]
MPLSNLPNELFYCIAEVLDSERDINTFTKINSRTYRLLNPYLYCYNVQHSGSSALLWAAPHGQETTAAKLLGERSND